jgi:hypothetical protein
MQMADEKNDGINAIPEQREMLSDPLGARSDEIEVLDRQGDFPNTLGPVGGRTRMTLEPYGDVDPNELTDGGPLDDMARHELSAHEKEREPVNEAESWDETGRSDLPAASSQPRVED